MSSNTLAFVDSRPSSVRGQAMLLAPQEFVEAIEAEVIAAVVVRDIDPRPVQFRHQRVTQRIPGDGVGDLAEERPVDGHAAVFHQGRDPGPVAAIKRAIVIEVRLDPVEQKRQDVDVAAAYLRISSFSSGVNGQPLMMRARMASLTAASPASRPNQRQKPSRLCPAGNWRPFDSHAQLAIEIDDMLRQRPAQGEVTTPLGLRERDAHRVIAGRVGRREPS